MFFFFFLSVHQIRQRRYHQVKGTFLGHLHSVVKPTQCTFCYCRVFFSVLEFSYGFYDSIINSWLPIVSGILASSQAQLKQLLQMSLEIPTSVSPYSWHLQVDFSRGWVCFSSPLHAKLYWFESWTFWFCFMRPWVPWEIFGAVGIWLIGFAWFYQPICPALRSMQWAVVPASALFSKPCVTCTLYLGVSLWLQQKSIIVQFQGLWGGPTYAQLGWDWNIPRIRAFPSALRSLWFCPILSCSSPRNIGFLLETVALHPTTV